MTSEDNDLHLKDQLARPVTLDQAYSNAYRRVRILARLYACYLSGEDSTNLNQAIEEVAQQLERDLSLLLYDDKLAGMLARP